MSYDILKDPLFYVSLLVFAGSAVVLLNSIKKLTALDNENSKDDEESLDTEKEGKDTDLNKNEEIIIDDKNGEIDIKTKEEESSKIEFEDEEENLFKLSSNQTETKAEKNLAEEFIIALNSNLEDIKKHLPPSDLMKRIENIEEKIMNIEQKVSGYSETNIISKISELEKNIEKIYSFPASSESLDSKKTAPKYIYKYIEDIVEDYENIDKEMIRKRLKIILNELDNVISRDGD
ncbi:MAG: hypothetical protein ACP5SD_02215 [Elusimicrobiales bacterium]